MDDNDGDISFTDFIDVFIDSHSHLFTVLGVFGAIAVYLTTIAGEPAQQHPSSIDVGIASSLIIFVGVAAILLRKYLKRLTEVYGSSLLDVQNMFFPFIALILFIALVASVLVLITEYTFIFHLLELGLGILLVFASITIVVRFAVWMDTRLSKFKFAPHLTTNIMIVGLIVIILGHALREVALMVTTDVVTYGLRVAAFAIASGGFTAAMIAWMSDEI